MKILVMGGTRFFGKRLVHSLIEENHEVWVLTRGQTTDDFGSKVHHLKADRKDKESLQAAVKNLHFDVVVDQICMTAAEAQIAVDVFASKTPYYVMTSTVSVYYVNGNLKEEDFNSLTYTPKAPTNAGEEYAENKRAAEKVFATKAPFKFAFARFPVVVGEDDYTERLLNQVKKIKNEKPIFFPNLEARFSLVTSEDAGRALHWLVHTKNEGAYNFASPKPIILGDLVRDMEAVTEKKAHLAKEISKENYSQYGIPSDYFVNTSKAESMGFHTKPITEWIRPLIKTLSSTF